MTRLIPNKLQTQRNFPSIWHSQPELISTFLREDEIIRYYITGTLKSSQWKVSEIIIKRRVAGLHIVFQAQFRLIKIRRYKTKNRKKNRHKYLAYLRKIRAVKKKDVGYRSILLYNLISLLTRRLRRFYPHDKISFYVQRVKVLHLHTQFINQWMTLQFKKKRSYYRSIFRVVNFFSRTSKRLTRSKWSTIQTLWWRFKKPEKLNLMAWLSSNLFYLYHLFGARDFSPRFRTQSSYPEPLNAPNPKRNRLGISPWANLPGEILWQKIRPKFFPAHYLYNGEPRVWKYKKNPAYIYDYKKKLQKRKKFKTKMKIFFFNLSEFVKLSPKEQILFGILSPKKKILLVRILYRLYFRGFLKITKSNLPGVQNQFKLKIQKTQGKNSTWVTPKDTSGPNRRHQRRAPSAKSKKFW